MPWKEASVITLRTEFVTLAHRPENTIAELCRRFGISRTTAYKWLARADANEPLSNRSKRPHASPQKTSFEMEERVICLRDTFPDWGGRKLSKVLMRDYHLDVAPSTVTHILRRHGRLGSPSRAASKPWMRFEHDAPNELWQMDFKGPVQVGRVRCDPLTVLDDHSRFNLVLGTNTDMCGSTVRQWLTEAFRRYGLPRRMNMDNGSPWGVGNGDSRHLSSFTIWLVQLGIHVSFSRPFHPQTNGKDERFHRTLDVEVLRRRPFHSIEELRQAFDQWREIYNHVRPHEALDMETPADRYTVSLRPFSEQLPAIEYGPDDILIRVGQRGRIRLLGHPLTVSVALHGHTIAARPRPTEDGVYDLFFSHHRLQTIDMRSVR